MSPRAAAVNGRIAPVCICGRAEVVAQRSCQCVINHLLATLAYSSRRARATAPEIGEALATRRDCAAPSRESEIGEPAAKELPELFVAVALR